MEAFDLLRSLVAIRHFVADYRLGPGCREDVDRAIRIAAGEDREAAIAALARLKNSLVGELCKALDERSEPTKLGLAIEEEVLRAQSLWTALVHPEEGPPVNQPAPYGPCHGINMRHRRRGPEGGESDG